MKYPLLILALGSGFCFGWIARPVSSSSSTETSKPHQAGNPGTRPAPQAQPVNDAQSGRKHVASAIGEFLTRHAENGQITAGGMANAIEEMSKVNDPLIRRALFNALLENLSRDNAVAAYTAMLKHSKSLAGNGELRLLANVWGRLDPLGAMDSIMKIRLPLHSGNASIEDTTNPEMVEILAGWAMTDPDGASRHVAGLADPTRKEMLTNGIVRGLLARGTDQALAYVSTIPATKENLKARQRYMGMIANDVVTQHGFEYATKWIETIADPSLKASGLARIVESTTKWDDLANWVTPYASEDYAKDAIAVFAKRWGDQEPGAVISWADEKFPEAAREIAYREAFGGWTRMDAAACSEVLIKMPPSRLRDTAVGEFARVLASDEPASAVKWAETIGDQARRTEVLLSVAGTWLKSDNAAAMNWLARSNLSEASVQKVLAAKR